IGGGAAAKPGFCTNRQQRQRLRQIVNRTEGIQRAGAGDADLVNAGRDRSLEIVAPSWTGIALPFAPGGNHFGSPRGRWAAAKFLHLLLASAAIGPGSERRNAQKVSRASNIRNTSPGPISDDVSGSVVMRGAQAVKSRHRDRRELHGCAC